MLGNKNSLLFHVFFFLSSEFFAQPNYYYPIAFTAYAFNSNQVSPAYCSEKHKANIVAGYSSLVGPFKKVSNYYTGFDREFSKDKTSVQNLGFYLYNERQGSYISVPRGYANYIYAKKLSQKIKISIGMNLGFVSFRYSAPTASLQTINLPDGSLGFSLHTTKFSTSVSSFQIFNNQHSHEEYSSKLQRYYQFLGEYKTHISPSIQLKTQVLWRTLPYIPDDFLMNVYFTFFDKSSIGVFHSYQKGTSFLFAFMIPVETDQVNVFFNYNSTLFSTLPTWQTNAELGVSYLIF